MNKLILPEFAAWFSGKTVIVTGATSGIGREIARKLAVYGANLLLCGRDRDVMRNFVEELKADSGSVLDYYLVDFSNKELLRKMIVEVKLKHDVDVLINNAAFGHMEEFHEMQDELISSMLNVNMNAMVDLCRAFIPDMIKKSSAGVLNIGSVASFFATPGSALYGATKHFVLGFTDALHKEVFQFGVNVTGVYPGHTHSRFIERASKGKKERWDKGMEPDVVAEQSLEGLSRNRIRVIPGVTNKLRVLVSKFLPVSVISNRIYNSSVVYIKNRGNNAK